MKRTVSAGGVVLNRRGEVLVVSQNGDSWSLPKGHLEPGEGELEAARREIAEESGIRSLRLEGELGRYERFKIARGGEGEDRSEIKTMVMFLFRTDEETLKPEDPKHPEARWVAPGEVPSLLTHPKDREFFLSVKGRLGNTP